MVAITSYQIYALKEFEDHLLVTTLCHVTTITFLSLPHLNNIGKVRDSSIISSVFTRGRGWGWRVG
jgi:hypothetical protein